MPCSHLLMSAGRRRASRRQWTLRCVGVGASFLLLWQQSAFSDCSVESQGILVGSEGFNSDDFGRAVDIDGNYAIVGTEDHAAGTEAGAAYFYMRAGDTWMEMQKVTGSDIDTGDRFGSSVALSGDTAVVGAFAHEGTGAAYIFVRDGGVWVEQAKLLAPDGVVGDEFGRDVDIDGESVIIGARGVDFPGIPNFGAAYIFVRSGTTWSHQQKVSSPNPIAFQLFGTVVSISGDTAVVGNPDDDEIATASGAAHVFGRAGGVWSHQQKLKAPDAQTSDLFGDAVAVSNDQMLIGAARDDQACPADIHCNSGSVYVYVRTGGTWTFDQLLTASDAETGDFFGVSLSMTDEVAIIGAPLAGPSAIGTAYVFSRRSGAWAQQAQMHAVDPNPSAQFGIAVGTDGESAISGAVYFNSAHPGEAYVYDVNCAGSAADITGDGVVDGADLAALLSSWGPCAGCPADINGDGVVDGADLAALLSSWT